MKRYKVGVVGASLYIGKSILKKIIDENFPYSFIRAISYEENNKEIKVGDYNFSSNKLSIESLKDLDLIIIIKDKVDLQEYIDYLNEKQKTYYLINNSLDENDNKTSDLIIKGIINDIEIINKEEIVFNCALELGDQGLIELNNQFIDYFNNRPLITSTPKINNHPVPLAFNLIPIVRENKLQFYIPSFYVNALILRIYCKDTSILEDKIRNNQNIKIYDKNLPSLFDAEGNDLIHIGIIDKKIDNISLFVTYDYTKIIINNLYKEIKVRIIND